MNEKKNEPRYPKLSKSDHILLKELCKNANEYLKVDITKLARTTKLARNTIAVRIEKLLREKLLKLIAVENLELEAYEGILCLIKLKITTNKEIYDRILARLRKEKVIEDIWEAVAYERGRRIIAFIIRYLAPYRLVGTKTYLRGRIVGAGGELMKIFREDLQCIDEMESYLLLDTPKLLFWYRLSNYDVITGEIKP